MKKAFFTLFAVALLAGTVAAQTSGSSAEQKATSTEKAIVVSGKVSADARTLLTDIDSEWAVSNVALLKGFEGRWVKVKCYVDTAKSKLQVLTVKTDDNTPRYAAAHMDSAFRR